MIARGEDAGICRISRKIRTGSKETVTAVYDRPRIRYFAGTVIDRRYKNKLARYGATRGNYVIREHFGQFVLQLAPEQQKIDASLD